MPKTKKFFIVCVVVLLASLSACTRVIPSSLSPELDSNLNYDSDHSLTGAPSTNNYRRARLAPAHDSDRGNDTYDGRAVLDNRNSSLGDLSVNSIGNSDLSPSSGQQKKTESLAASSDDYFVNSKDRVIGIINGEVEPPTPEEYKAELKDVGKKWFFGPGFGTAFLNVSLAVTYPPYALYLLGNAGLELSGIGSVYPTDLLPEKPAKVVSSGFHGLVSVPGRINAFIFDEDFYDSSSYINSAKPDSQGLNDQKPSLSENLAESGNLNSRYSSNNYSNSEYSQSEYPRNYSSYNQNLNYSSRE